MKLIPSAALCAALAALAVAGCGGDDESSSESGSGGGAATSDTTAQKPAPAPSGGGGGGSSNLQLAADESGQLEFDKSSLSAKAGKVTITMDNPAPVPHAVSIEGNGVDEDGKTVGMGGKSTVMAELKAGKYTFYCPVDGHEAAGMKGTLTVK
jgi:plastocyanin